MQSEKEFNIRFERAKKQEIKIKRCLFESSIYVFEAGIYNSRLEVSTSNITCDCTDFLMNEWICKHLIHLLLNEFKLEYSFVYSNGIRSCRQYIEMCSGFLIQWNQTHMPELEPITPDIPKIETKQPDNECIVCMVEIDVTKKHLLISCKKCNMVVHVNCLKNFVLKMKITKPPECCICQHPLDIPRMNIANTKYKARPYSGQKLVLQSSMDRFIKLQKTMDI
jgi:SWIM zinc finger